MKDKQLEERIRNQIRIHWCWLKNFNAKDLSDFIIAIITNLGREKQ